MNKCQRCASDRIMRISGKTSDCFSLDYKDLPEYEGYVPSEIGLGEGGDYIDLDYCVECGQIQGKFPIEETHIANQLNTEE